MTELQLIANFVFSCVQGMIIKTTNFLT